MVSLVTKDPLERRSGFTVASLLQMALPEYRADLGRELEVRLSTDWSDRLDRIVKLPHSEQANSQAVSRYRRLLMLVMSGEELAVFRCRQLVQPTIEQAVGPAVALHGRIGSIDLRALSGRAERQYAHRQHADRDNVSGSIAGSPPMCPGIDT